MRRKLIILLLAATLSSCGGDGDGGGGDNATHSLALDFARVETGILNPFQVTVSVYKDGQPLSGAEGALDIELSRGTRDAVTEVSAGTYLFTVTPTQSGEHSVTVSYKSASTTRTALVLPGIDAGWEQPMAVPGLVNTPGYEDGATITPDGEYLFVQYGPWYMSGFFLFNMPRVDGGCEGNRLVPTRCTHSWIDNSIGPYTGPERPGFFDGGISGTTLLHNAASWGLGVEEVPIFAPMTMIYGFKRQADGSFAQPFYLAFSDMNDGLIGPYGRSFLMHGDGTATVIFSVDDPSDPDWVDTDGDGTADASSRVDVYAAEITFGQNNILGTFVASGTPGTPPVRSTPFPSQLVNFGKTGPDGIAGTQGNPQFFQIGGAVQSIWTDDEYDNDSDTGDIAVYVLTSGTLLSGTWSKLLLPSPVNLPAPSSEIQPYFTGSGLYFTRSSDVQTPEIYFASYSGPQTLAGYQTVGNWGTPVKVLAVDGYALGNVVGIGQPTIATYGGAEYLYFTYGYVRDFDPVSGLADLDMQAGYVRKK